jgi:septal ring factor EnvC (AmiA/AmiB activator)
MRIASTEPGRRLPAVLLLVALTCALAVAARAGATDIGALQHRVVGAQSEAGELAAGLRESRERLADAQRREAAASTRERRLSALLAEGERRAARLAERVERERQRLRRERARLRRARSVLAQRLVSIYEHGDPSAAAVVLSAGDFAELTTWASYMDEIQASDHALAARVEQVRDAVRDELDAVARLKARVDAYDERLAVARSQIAGVRQRAQQAATEEEAIAAERQASLAKLKSKISQWTDEIQAAKRAAAEAASRAAAEETVERWLGGPYSIPTYIVMCESGGDYGAVNPSSGAGGAYQILPSTWSLYGGQGAPQDAPKAEQDRIAAEIWADSGPSAWSCG